MIVHDAANSTSAEAAIAHQQFAMQLEEPAEEPIFFPRGVVKPQGFSDARTRALRFAVLADDHARGIVFSAWQFISLERGIRYSRQAAERVRKRRRVVLGTRGDRTGDRPESSISCLNK